MKYHGKFSLAAAGIGITLAALLFAVSPALAAVTSNILPTGDGYSLQWTPSTGTTHFTLVDETSCNGTTDYNFTATVGQRDAYAVDISSIPDGSTITAVAEKPCASRNSTGGGSATLDVFYRTNGVNSADAGSYALPTGTAPLDLATTTFSGLSSVKSSSTSFQVGAVYTAGTKGIRLSRLATQITYTTLNAPSGLTASSSVSSTTVVTLNWTDNATNETSNVIERGLSTSSFAQIGSVGSTTRR